MGQLLRVESEDEREALARLLAARILTHRGEKLSHAAMERETLSISRWISVGTAEEAAPSRRFATRAATRAIRGSAAARQ